MNLKVVWALVRYRVAFHAGGGVGKVVGVGRTAKQDQGNWTVELDVAGKGVGSDPTVFPRHDRWSVDGN